MPPFSLSNTNDWFLPGYLSLFFCDKIILDASSWNALKELYEQPNAERSRQAWFYNNHYVNVAEVILNLYDEGYIEVHDFDEIILSSIDSIREETENDLKSLEKWKVPLEESHKVWKDFIEKSDSYLDKESGGFHQFKSRWEARGFDSDFMGGYYHLLSNKMAFLHYHGDKSISESRYREHVEERLSYINSHLALSLKLGAGLYDWDDYLPFYEYKLDRIFEGAIMKNSETNKVSQFFEVLFPDFPIHNPKSIIKIFKDKRIDALRAYLRKAMEENISFDHRYAAETLREVLEIEYKIQRFRSIASWVSLPLGFIPIIGTPLQKIIEETSTSIGKKKNIKNFRWYFFISSLKKNLKQL